MPLDYQPYITLIDKVIEMQILGEPDAPQIAITSLLLSEIINRYTRDTAMQKHFGKGIYKQKDFKKDYRPTEHYQQNLTSLLNSLHSFKECFFLLPDNLAELDFFEKLADFNEQNKDFNDFYFYQLAKKYDFPIVTHDGDFEDQDIIIITQNANTLAKKARFSPKKHNR